jgi:hypothetical protein
VVSMRAPDAGACERLMRLYARDRLPVDESVQAAAAKLSGEIPAVVREVVERAKLAAAGRMLASGQPLYVRDLHLTGGDLETAADSMLTHIRLLRERANRVDPDDVSRFAKALGESLFSGFRLLADEDPPGLDALTKQSRLDYDRVVDELKAK